MTVDSLHSAHAPPEDTDAVRYRYPGAPPFEDTDLARRLFSGRADEADTVLHSILSTDLFLLYAESGLGKTSLLNAGVLHELRARGHWPVSVRLNDTERSPAALVHAAILAAAVSDSSVDLIDELPLAEENASLWDVLGALEVWRGNDLQTPVIIFDQFEEIFTLQWGDQIRQRFIAEFGEVVRGHREQPSGRPDELAPRPRVKFVLVIREDSLGELEALSTEVPQIMRNRFRLGGLAPASADAAIREPGLLNDDRLGSQRFEYTPAAATEILKFLRSSRRSGADLTTNVDPSQLQIVCQYVERAIVPHKSATGDDGVVQIDVGDLGGKAGLDRILSAFYRRNLAPFGTSQRRQIRRLCEKGLISPQERRLSLEESQIGKTFGVDVPTLQTLVDGRLLRAQPRLDSVSYELAHDTLIPAIAADRQRRCDRRRATAVTAIGCAFLLLAAFAIAAVVRGADDDSTEEALPVSEPPFLVEASPTSTAPPLLVPNVVGMNVDDAIGQLADLGLRTDVLEVSSDSAPGDVLSQSPTPVEMADEQTVVVLQVSIGRGVVLRDDFVVTTPGRGTTVNVLLNDDGNSVRPALTPSLIEADDGIDVDVQPSGDVVVSADAPGAYVVTYGVGDAAPDQMATLLVTVEEFEAVILQPPDLAEVGAPVLFVGDSQGSIAARTWQFGDGNTATGQRVEHTYDTAGTYSVTLTITDEAGAENTSAPHVINVVDPAGTVAFEWPYGDFFEVPQRGREPVRGAGCGGDNSIGEQIPDGTWYGNLPTIDRSAGTLSFDLICVFYDEAGAEIIAADIGSGPADFYEVNNLARFRTVELHPEFTHHDAIRTAEGCVDPGPGAEAASDRFKSESSWLIIAEGQAVFALTSCVEV